MSFNVDLDRICYDFDKGIIVEHIVGKGKYFKPEITYRNLHDYFYIMDQLEEWATQNNKLDQLEGYIIEALKELDKDSNVQNTILLLHDIIYSAKTEKRKNFFQTLDFTKILDIAVPILNKNAIKLVENGELRDFLFNCCIRLPELAKRLEISTENVYSPNTKVIIG